MVDNTKKDDSYRKQKAILLVEDDPDIMWTNTVVFKSEGYTVIPAITLKEALLLLDESPMPDVIVLDLKLPDGNALDIISDIKKKTNAPILILTALIEKEERLAGLRAGGDDYITKPYDIDELCARVVAFLRREEMHEKKPPADTFTHGPITLNVMTNQAYINGASMELTVKEFSLLHIFVRNEGKTLTKDHLYTTVWGQELLDDDRVLRSAVSRLRSKLEASGCEYDIVSSRSEGYMFVEG